MAEKKMEWTAGEAALAPIEAGQARQGRWLDKAAVGLGMAGALAWGGVVKPMLYIAVIIQAASIADQAWREHKTAVPIAQMKAEQAWLKSQGLAEGRRLGVLAPTTRGHFPWDDEGETHTGKSLSIANIDLAYPMRWIVGDWADKRVGISVSTQERKPSYFDPELAITYRHEEGHARAFDKKLRATASKNWPMEVSAAVLPVVDVLGTYADESPAASPSSLPGAWREKWLSSARREAFADAFAVLSAARKKPGEMARVALAAHAFRVVPNMRSLTSTDIAGSDHAVEMASFIAGQFDQAKVAKLGPAGLDALAGRVADDSLAWILARQGPLIGFFEEPGRAWWTERAKRSGLSDSAAVQAWRQWSKEASAAYPWAAFGDFSYEVEGLKFEARGLDKDLAQSNSKREDDRSRLRRAAGLSVEAIPARWRYDGHAGVVVLENRFDASIKGPGQALMVRKETGEWAFGRATTIRENPEAQDRIQGALMGAASQQMLLAARLGVDLEEHAKWLMKGEGESGSDFMRLARSYAAVMDQYGFPKTKALAASPAQRARAPKR